MDVTISLVCHNQWHDLEQLLPTLLPAAQLVESEILLVDNRSIDGTSAYVRSSFPQLHVTANPAKAGYGKNHNLNLPQARGRYFVIMNSDMTVDSEVFRKLTKFMDQHIDVGIVTPKVLSQDGSIQGLNKRYPTIIDLLLRRFVPRHLQHLFRSRLDYYEMRDVGYEHIYDVPFLSGAFMFCRTNLLRDLGGFDPGYFLYFEDVDLCRRIQASHRTVFFPGAVVTHFWKRSSHGSWSYTYHFLRSALRYFAKWGYRLY